MGCFDSVCCISRIPIRHHEKVIQIYITTTGDLRNFAGTNFGGLWQPLSLPIRGEYNDYGELEEIPKDDIGQLFLAEPLMKMFEDATPPTFREPEGGLKRFIDEVRCGHQTLPDRWTYGANNEWTNEESCGRTFKRLQKHNGSVVSGLLIHAEMWDYICSLGPIKNIEHEIDTFLQARTEKLSGDYIPESAKRYLEALSDEQRAKISDEEMANLIMDFSFESRMDTNELSKALTVGATTASSEYGVPLYHMVAKDILIKSDMMVQEKLEEYSAEEVRGMLRLVCELINFRHGSFLVNRNLEPPVHLASQHQQIDEALATYDFFKKAMELQRQKIINSYHGDPLDCYYDEGDPEMDRILEVCPELAPNKTANN